MLPSKSTKKTKTKKKPIVVIPNNIKTLPTTSSNSIISQKSFTEKVNNIKNDIDVDIDDIPEDLIDVWDELKEYILPKMVSKNYKLWLSIFTPLILPSFLKGISGQVRLPFDAKQSIQTNVPNEKQIIDHAREYFKSRGLELVRTLSQTDCERLKVQLKDNWGKGPTEFKKSFEEDYANTKARLDSIYRTEYVTAQNEGILARSRDAGHKMKQWNAALDERTCPVCGDQLHGTIIPIEEQFSFVLESKNGSEEVVKNAPPAHVNCRCVLTTLNEEDYDEIKEDSAYLEDVSDFIKLNYKCKAGTVDDSNKCGTEQDKTNKLDNPSVDILKSKTLENLYSNKENVPLYSEKSDIVMNELAKEIGYDAKPKLVTTEEINNEISNGSLELFRGLTPSAAEQIKNGQYDARSGSYGNGIYAAVGDDSTAKFYAGDTGKVIRMSLDKNAKIVDFNDLEEEQHKYLNSFPKEYRMYSSGPSNSMDELTKEQAMHYILSDPGRFAAFRGYDAILIHHFAPVNSTDINVLNRSVLHIEDDNKEKQNSSYLADAFETIKLNYKCPKGTVDDSNKCNTENKHASETFIGFKADHDFSSKKSEILKTPRAKLVSLIDPELDNKLNNLSEQAKTLSKSEKHILSEYSLNEYININEFLTKKIEKNIPNPEELDILYKDAVLEQAKENVEKLDNIFKNVSLPENIVSYRGLRDDILVENRELMEALDTPGSEVSFDCFSSSSVMPFVASNFATGYNGRLIELRLPKGSKALYIAEVSMSPSEYELLINRGTKFKVLESKTVEIMNPYKENNDKTKFKVTTLQAIV